LPLSLVARPTWCDRWLGLAVLVPLPLWGLLSLWMPLASGFDLPLREPLLYLQVALLYPVLEEIVFRGALQGYLQERLAGRQVGGVSLANLLTSLLFSLTHLIFRSATTAMLVFLPSLIFGYFRERDGGLRIPIALHCYYNGGFYLLFVS